MMVGVCARVHALATGAAGNSEQCAHSTAWPAAASSICNTAASNGSACAAAGAAAAVRVHSMRGFDCLCVGACARASVHRPLLVQTSRHCLDMWRACGAHAMRVHVFPLRVWLLSACLPCS